MKEQAINLRQQGLSYGNISMLLGISKSTAYEYCKNYSKVDSNYESKNSERSEKRSIDTFNEIEILYGVSKNELEYTKKDNKQLEEEVYRLRTENHKLANENSDLTVKVRTAEREKDIAVAQARLECKANQNSGLGALTDPQLLSVLGDLAVKVIPMFKKPDPNVCSLPDELKVLNETKKETVYFIAAKITPLSDEESSKLAWLINCIVDHKKIEEFFVNWQKS